MELPVEDTEGVVYMDHFKKTIAIGPYRNWNKTPIFLTEAVGKRKVIPRDSPILSERWDFPEAST